MTDNTAPYPPDVTSIARARTTPATRLHALADLHDRKAAEYGATWRMYGEFFMSAFPDGMRIESAEDANRAALFFHIGDKFIRYATNFNRGGHADSLDDLAVYAQMLRTLDAEIKARKETVETKA
jgi:hypothetical protein